MYNFVTAISKFCAAAAVGASALMMCMQASASEKISLAAIPYALTAPAAAGVVSTTVGALTLSASKGTDLYADPSGKESADNTPRVLFNPQGDFIFSAKVNAAFKREFDGGALIVYADKRNWAKLLFENPRSGKPGISSTVARGAGDDAHHGSREGAAVHLKIVRRGPMYVFYTSPDGQQWQMLRSFALAEGSPVQVGFSAQSPVGEQFVAQFTDIRFRAATFKDFWQGE